MEIKKKPRENVSILLRRFTQKVREGGILINAKKSMFQEKKISRSERRKTALEREKKRKQKQKLRKMGQL